MSEIDVENWMHFSDEERQDAIKSWDISRNDGKDIITAVANLFKNECVYNVIKSGVGTSNQRWVINAYVEKSDYESLKNRYNVGFLGFPIVFKNADELA